MRGERLEFLVDSQLLWRCISGRTDPCGRSYTGLVESIMQNLGEAFDQGWRCRQDVEDPIQWIPRELNRGADRAANRAKVLQGPYFAFSETLFSALETPNVFWRVQTDAGMTQATGEGYTGAIFWVCLPQTDTPTPVLVTGGVFDWDNAWGSPDITLYEAKALDDALSFWWHLRSISKQPHFRQTLDADMDRISWDHVQDLLNLDYMWQSTFNSSEDFHNEADLHKASAL